MIPDILQIHLKATGVDLHFKDEEMRELLAIFRKYDGATVVAAYRICQKEKPGKPFAFFLDDFAMYYAKVQKRDEDQPCPECHGSRGCHAAKCSHHPDALSIDKGPPPAAVDTFDDFPEETKGEAL
jgi:hypothetical protein